MVDGEMISREEFLRGFLRVYDLLEFPEPADAEACPRFPPKYFPDGSAGIPVDCGCLRVHNAGCIRCAGLPVLLPSFLF